MPYMHQYHKIRSFGSEVTVMEMAIIHLVNVKISPHIDFLQSHENQVKR